MKHENTTLIETLSATQMRNRFGISRATEYRWERKGLLKPRRVGVRKFYLVEDLNELLTNGDTAR